MESDSNDPESVKLCPEIPLPRQHVGDEVCFFLMVHLQFQDGIEELDCVVEGWAASVVEVVHNIGTQHWGQAHNIGDRRIIGLQSVAPVLDSISSE